MFNNFQDIFLKYKNDLNSKKKQEENILLFLNQELHLKLVLKNLKIDFLKNQLEIINLNSTYRFILKNKLDNNLKSKIKQNFNLDLKV